VCRARGKPFFADRDFYKRARIDDLTMQCRVPDPRFGWQSSCPLAVAQLADARRQRASTTS
jgi:hypothetical protein